MSDTPAAPKDASQNEETHEEGEHEEGEHEEGSDESQTPSPGPPGALRNFFLMEDALREAEREQFHEEQPGFAELQQALALVEAATNLTAGQARLERSDGTAAAELLLREAIHWGLVAQLLREGIAPGEREVPDLWKAAIADEGPLADLSPEQRSRVEAALAPRPRNAFLPAPDRHAEVQTLRAGAAEILTPLEAATTKADAVRVTRLLRWLGVVALVALAVGAVARLVPQLQRGPNLALHKPVTSSPQIAGYSASTITDGVTSTLGSHSDNEQNPWVQIDLGAPTRIARVVVYNRSDFGEDRAVPMIIETSTDGRSYQQAARRDAEFHVWDAKLNPVNARYVRLKVDKRTHLHLNEVTVHAK